MPYGTLGSFHAGRPAAAVVPSFTAREFAVAGSMGAVYVVNTATRQEAVSPGVYNNES
jgi:hypothetical protein